MPQNTLIDMKRIELTGGLGNPGVLRILGRFVTELDDYLRSLDRCVTNGDHQTLLATLHRMKGAARTCGFVAVAEAAGEWLDAPEEAETQPLRESLFQSVETSVREWNLITAPDPT